VRSRRGRSGLRVSAIKVFETQLASERDVWGLVVDKARAWVRTMMVDGDVKALEKLVGRYWAFEKGSVDDRRLWLLFVFINCTITSQAVVFSVHLYEFLRVLYYLVFLASDIGGEHQEQHLAACGTPSIEQLPRKNKAWSLYLLSGQQSPRRLEITLNRPAK
jgi:hypothetical protein